MAFFTIGSMLLLFMVFILFLMIASMMFLMMVPRLMKTMLMTMKMTPVWCGDTDNLVFVNYWFGFNRRAVIGCGILIVWCGYWGCIVSVHIVWVRDMGRRRRRILLLVLND